MKIKTYRILFLLTMTFVFLVSLFSIYVNILDIKQSEGNFLGLLMNLVGIIGVSIVSLLEMYFIFRSFTKGTLMLKDLCFQSNGEKSKVYFYGSIICFLISLFGSIWFILAFFKINNLIPTFIASDNLLFLNLSLVVLVDSLFLIIYMLFMKYEDYTSK